MITEKAHPWSSFQTPNPIVTSWFKSLENSHGCQGKVQTSPEALRTSHFLSLPQSSLFPCPPHVPPIHSSPDQFPEHILFLHFEQSCSVIPLINSNISFKSPLKHHSRKPPRTYQPISVAASMFPLHCEQTSSKPPIVYTTPLSHSTISIESFIYLFALYGSVNSEGRNLSSDFISWYWHHDQHIISAQEILIKWTC